jgi:hypothetical protein
LAAGTIGTAMKSILPLLLVAAAAQAEITSVKAPADSFSLTADNFMIARDVDDFDGMSYGIKAKVWDGARMTLGFADATSDRFDLVSGLNVEVGARRFAVGAEYDMHIEQGIVTLSLAYGQTTGRTKGGFVGDAFRNQQFVLGASYARPLGEGFTAILSANKFLSDFDTDKGFSTASARTALAERFDGSPFSVGLTLAYTPVEYVTVHLTYATEDSVLGLGRADNTLSFGVRANF